MYALWPSKPVEAGTQKFPTLLPILGSSSMARAFSRHPKLTVPSVPIEQPQILHLSRWCPSSVLRPSVTPPGHLQHVRLSSPLSLRFLLLKYFFPKFHLKWKGPSFPTISKWKGGGMKWNELESRGK